MAQAISNRIAREAVGRGKPLPRKDGRSSVEFIFLAIVVDLWSRRLVGCAIGESMSTALVLQALTITKPQEVTYYSDQGSQYTGIALGKRGREMGIKPSTGSVGDAYDNATAEASSPASIASSSSGAASVPP